MKYLIIGTAGHVDHGKSALIKALTGTDTDRLKEEKLRGISIDLGFASLNLDKDMRAGIVDVPGHERFLKNMLAGTGGIDIALLVVAADEGIMPQTREHLAMLNLYGIKHGVVAVNKIDKVDEEWLELIEDEIKGLMSGSFLADAPICRVSAANGQGIEELRKSLTEVAEKLPARDSQAPFRLWIDRVFTVKGHGAVVTGSVLSGRLAIGESISLYPEGKSVRIRGLETHGSKVDAVAAGQRAAINITGIDLDEIERGMALGAADRGQTSTGWDVLVDWYEEVENGTRVRLHLGTGEYLGRIYNFKDSSNKYMRLLLETSLYSAAGDRGIIRLYSPQTLIGGVVMIAPDKNTRKLSDNRRNLGDAIYSYNWSQGIYEIINENGQFITEKVIKLGTGYIRDSEVNNILTELEAQGSIIKLDCYYITANALAALTAKANKLLTDYYEKYPDRLGLSREIMRQKLGFADVKAFDIFCIHLEKSEAVTINGADIALKDHMSRHSDWQQKLAAKTENALEGIGLVNIDEKLLGEMLKLSAGKERAAFDALVRQGLLVKVADMHVYRKTIQYIVGLVKGHFSVNSTITVGELRDALNTSRKVALPILEYLDMHKYTIRDGDIRRPGQRLLDLSE